MSMALAALVVGSITIDVLRVVWVEWHAWVWCNGVMRLYERVWGRFAMRVYEKARLEVRHALGCTGESQVREPPPAPIDSRAAGNKRVEESVSASSDPQWSRREVAITLSLALAAFVCSKLYMTQFRAGGGTPEFYQAEFSPAVMQACGRGFVNPDAAVAGLSAFVGRETDTFRCGDLPPTLRTRPPNGLQGVTRYLMTCVALVWRITGITWRAVDMLTSAFVAVSVAGAYLAARFVAGPSLAVFVTLLWACSPRHFQNLPHLRDYSKTPYFMVMLIAIGIAATERRPRRLVALGIAFGAVEGLGFGMRTDMVLNFVPFLLVLFAAPYATLVRGLATKLAVATAAAATFLAVSYPVVRTYTKNSSLWHVVLLGLTSPYDENLRIGFPRPAYSFPYAHNDGYIETVIRTYWSRLHPADPPLALITPAYDSACRRYFEQLARTFPADMMTRSIASAVSVANLPFWLPIGHEIPVGISQPRLISFWSWRAWIMRRGEGFGLLLVAASIFVLGIVRPRYAAIGFVLFWFWAAMPALEFQGRHIYQFEFLFLAAFVGAAVMFYRLVVTARGAHRARVTAASCMRSLVLVAAMFAAVVVMFAAARLIQIPRARALVTAYATVPSTPLEPRVIALENARNLLSLDLFHSAREQNGVEEAVVKAEFDLERCGKATTEATFRYQVTNPELALDFSRPTPLDYLGTPPSQVFLPVYAIDRDWKRVSTFVGVEVPATLTPCVRLSRVAPASVPIAIPMKIEPDWPRKLYERVRLGDGLGY
jgi:hypothetical protein